MSAVHHPPKRFPCGKWENSRLSYACRRRCRRQCGGSQKRGFRYSILFSMFPFPIAIYTEFTVHHFVMPNFRAHKLAQTEQSETDEAGRENEKQFDLRLYASLAMRTKRRSTKIELNLMLFPIFLFHLHPNLHHFSSLCFALLNFAFTSSLLRC